MMVKNDGERYKDDSGFCLFVIKESMKRKEVFIHP